MLEFVEKNIVFTGAEIRVSKKGEEYILVNFLGSDGKTFACVCDCQIPSNLKQLDRVDVTFKVLPGRYTQLRVLNLSKAS